MNRDEFARVFAAENNTSIELAKQWCNAVLDQLAKEIVLQPRIEIRGLGVWEHKKYAGRMVRNFKTGQSYKLDDVVAIKYRQSTLIDEKLKEIYKDA
jgi:nucleoid DNA-binding protein